MIDVRNLNGLNWRMGDWGGLGFFLRSSADSGEIAPQQKQSFDAFFRQLPSFLRWDDRHQVYVLADPDPDYPAAIGFTNAGVYIEFDSGGGQWGHDMKAITRFAATLGLFPFDLETDNSTFVRIDEE